MRDISVEIGKSIVYKVPDYDASDIKWSIGNPAVATVDANGKVTGARPFCWDPWGYKIGRVRSPCAVHGSPIKNHAVSCA